MTITLYNFKKSKSMLQNKSEFKKVAVNFREAYNSIPDEDKGMFKQMLCCAVSISGAYSMRNVMRYINGNIPISYAEKVMIFQIFESFNIVSVGGVSPHDIFKQYNQIFRLV